MMKIDLIAGARPNFMKIAPIIEAIEKAENEGRILVTGWYIPASTTTKK